jgi:hypothetical protein
MPATANNRGAGEIFQVHSENIVSFAIEYASFVIQVESRPITNSTCYLLAMEKLLCLKRILANVENEHNWLIFSARSGLNCLMTCARTLKNIETCFITIE